MKISNSGLVEDFAQRVYRIKDPVTGESRPMPLDRIQLTPWAYTLTFAALTQAQITATQIVNIQANSDFILTEVAVRPNLAAIGITNSTVPVPFLRMLLTDSGTNEQLTAAPVDVNLYCSMPGQGFDRELPYYRLLTGKSSLTCQMTNYSPGAGETYTFDVVFQGVNVRLYG